MVNNVIILSIKLDLIHHYEIFWQQNSPTS